MLSVVPVDVIRRQFQPRVHRRHVPNVQLRAARAQAFDNALNFSLIFGRNLGPENVLRGVPIEVPALGTVGQVEFDRLLRILDFAGELISVLKSDLGGRPLQMHEDPAVLFRAAERILQRGSGWGSRAANASASATSSTPPTKTIRRISDHYAVVSSQLFRRPEGDGDDAQPDHEHSAWFGHRARVVIARRMLRRSTWRVRLVGWKLRGPRSGREWKEYSGTIGMDGGTTSGGTTGGVSTYETEVVVVVQAPGVDTLEGVTVAPGR